MKALRDIRFEQYVQAQQTGWVLYLEGSTDLAILQAFAEKLGHPAQDVLKRPFVHYVGNQPKKVLDHFGGLRDAKTDLVGFCLFDPLKSGFLTPPGLEGHIWKQREIENYLCHKEMLMAWAEKEGEQQTAGPLFAYPWRSVMEETMAELERSSKASPWSPHTKASDDFLDPLFDSFFKKLGLENLMRKTNYHTLVQYVPTDQIDPEVSEVLDGILEIANQAKPVGDG